MNISRRDFIRMVAMALAAAPISPSLLKVAEALKPYVPNIDDIKLRWYAPLPDRAIIPCKAILRWSQSCKKCERTFDGIYACGGIEERELDKLGVRSVDGLIRLKADKEETLRAQVMDMVREFQETGEIPHKCERVPA